MPVPASKQGATSERWLVPLLANRRFARRPVRLLPVGRKSSHGDSVARSGVKEQHPDRDQWPSSKGLDGTRQPWFVVATSMPPAPSPALLRAESTHPG
jgi:hypothetical protein